MGQAVTGNSVGGFASAVALSSLSDALGITDAATNEAKELGAPDPVFPDSCDKCVGPE